MGAADPLTGTKCSGALRIIALIQDPGVCGADIPSCRFISAYSSIMDVAKLDIALTEIRACYTECTLAHRLYISEGRLLSHR